jgi:hypothetical protein
VEACGKEGQFPVLSFKFPVSREMQIPRFARDDNSQAEESPPMAGFLLRTSALSAA